MIKEVTHLVKVNTELETIKNLTELPPHISYDEYQKVLEAIDEYYDGKKPTQVASKHRFRDKLFFKLMWQTGARVDDLCNMLATDIDFFKKILALRVQKTKKTVKITLDDTILLEISQYLSNYKVEGKIFGFTRQYAWRMVKKYGKLADIEGLHPHKFRHGLAIHLLNNGVPIPVISARLGHSTTAITQQMYLKITPELQREFLKNVRM